MFGRFARASGIPADDVYVVATSAIRDATNGQDFLERAETESGLKIEILDAAQEAFYGYVAAVNTSTLTDGAVLDIGGGSLQLTRVEGRQNTEMASFPLGAVRTTEQFLSEPGPAKRKALQRLRDHVDEQLSSRTVGQARATAAAPAGRDRRRRPQPRGSRRGGAGLDRPRCPGIRDHARDPA